MSKEVRARKVKLLLYWLIGKSTQGERWVRTRVVDGENKFVN